MEGIKKKLKEMLKDGGMIYLYPPEAKQLIQALDWRGCDSCEHCKFDAVFNQNICRNLDSSMYCLVVDKTTSCIHHKKGE